MKPLPTMRAAQIDSARPSSAAQNWLIEGLWSAEAVGIIGGEPKCGKSFLALDLAVSVASGAPCLRHFPTCQCGPVLLFAAEDAAHIVRARLEGIAAAAAIDFQNLDVHLIAVPALRLDRHDHQQALAATVAQLQPKLLVLDPFVRLHCIDENVAAEVAPLLAYLRSLQRCHHTAVARSHLMPARAPPTSAAAKPCAARPNSTPGGTQICIYVALGSNCCSVSSIAPLQAEIGCRSYSKTIHRCSLWRSWINSRFLHRQPSRPAGNASNRSSPMRASPSR